MKRIVVVGNLGSGKTTLAKALADKLGLVHIDLDDLHHLPGWKERPRDDFRRLLTEAVSAEKWAVSGHRKERAEDIAWPAADTLIWLDMPFWPNFWRFLKRDFSNYYNGKTICNGNKPTFKQFGKDHTPLGFLNRWRMIRKRYSDIFANPEAYPNLTFIRLQSYQQSREFLNKA